ncbi:putative Cullin repeat-like-containing domain protein [Trachipleistophora hominis]|uniref:Putative Cullin repeat-like-containing domain protein n=1 Tax=Trachipleistophora hominis TaxID=72359 RepID=L7K0H1_TRAHO|nr:putative Cullin repeat-like-containing domain protein [Trachipleistophora hominis]
MDHDQRATLRTTIQAALVRRLKSHEYIKSYNTVFKYCTQRTNTFEILGEKMYLILYAEIDTYTKDLTYTSMSEFINEAIRYERAVESICGVFKYLTRFYIRCNLDLRMSNVMPLKKMMYSLFYSNFACTIENVLVHSLDCTVIRFYYKLLLYSDALRKFEEVKTVYADNIVFDGDAGQKVQKLENCLNEVRSVFTGKNVEDVLERIRSRIGNVHDIVEYLCGRVCCRAYVNYEVIDALGIHGQLFERVIAGVLDEGMTVSEELRESEKLSGGVTMSEELRESVGLSERVTMSEELRESERLSEELRESERLREGVTMSEKLSEGVTMSEKLSEGVTMSERLRERITTTQGLIEDERITKTQGLVKNEGIEIKDEKQRMNVIDTGRTRARDTGESIKLCDTVNGHGGNTAQEVQNKGMINDRLRCEKLVLDEEGYQKEYVTLINGFIYCSELNDTYFKSEDYQKMLREAFLARIKDKRKVYDAIVQLMDRHVKHKVVQRTDEHEYGRAIKDRLAAKKWDVLIDLLEIFGDDLHKMVHLGVLRRVLLDENSLVHERILVARMEEKIKYFGKTRLALADFLSGIHRRGGIMNVTSAGIISDANVEMEQESDIELNSPNTLAVPGFSVRCFTKYFWPIRATCLNLNSRLEEMIGKISQSCKDRGYRIEFNYHYSKVELKINEHVVTCDAMLASLILDINDHKKINVAENKADIDRLVCAGVVIDQFGTHGDEQAENLEINDNLAQDVNLFSPEFKMPVSPERVEHCTAITGTEILKCKIARIMKRSKRMNVADLQALVNDNIDDALTWLLKYNYVKQVDDILEYVP